MSVRSHGSESAPVQFECVGAISVGGFFRHVLGQVDDHDRIEWTFLRRSKSAVSCAAACTWCDGGQMRAGARRELLCMYVL